MPSTSAVWTSSAPSPITRRALVRARAALALAGPPALLAYAWSCLLHEDGRLVAPSPALVAGLPRPTLLAAGLLVGLLALERLLWRFAFGASFAVLSLLVALRALPPSLPAERAGPLLATATLLAALLPTVARSPRLGRLVAALELPRLCATRLGPTLWLALDLSFAAQQVALFGTVSTPMLLVCLFHALAVVDGQGRAGRAPRAPFGFARAFRQLVWTPFVGALPAGYLATHPFELPEPLVVALIALAFAAFRLRRSTSPRASSLGELGLGLAACLLTGAHAALPYAPVAAQLAAGARARLRLSRAS